MSTLIGKDNDEMQETMKKKVYIIGHKNPDTDSICSAIAYADVKNKIGDAIYVPKRAGQVSEETQFVLDRFGIKPPGYVPNVGTRVKDMDIRRIPGVSHSISLKKAWTLMKDENVNTLPITRIIIFWRDLLLSVILHSLIWIY